VSFKIAAIDGHLPGGGLATGAVHEIIAGDDSMAATGFALAFAARLFAASGRHSWLWCGQGLPLYAPGLATFGLIPEAGLMARVASDREVLWAMEEGLACRALAIVFGEVGNLDASAGRRLALAARESGTTAIVLRGPGTEKTPSMAATRWRVNSIPLVPTSIAPPHAGAHMNIGENIDQDGYAWQLDLLHGRGVMPRTWQVLWRPGAATFPFPSPSPSSIKNWHQDGHENEISETQPTAGALSLAPPLSGGTDIQGEAASWRRAG
jgi:protein ImuA